jgi:orotate phosphoribosyltransferase
VNTELIEFLAKSGAIKFGEFILKSGRVSPYFISTGVLCDGESSYELGRYFAKKINEVYGNNFDAVFGPAYKGIPIAISTSIALHKEFGINKPWLFDRKEKKVYGDASAFVGGELDKYAKVIIVDDVFTTGETKMEAVEKIKSLYCDVVGIVIAVDRMEKGIKLNAIEEFTNKTNIPVYSLTNIQDVFDYLRNRKIDGKIYITEKIYEQFIKYKEKYGV